MSWNWDQIYKVADRSENGSYHDMSFGGKILVIIAVVTMTGPGAMWIHKASDCAVGGQDLANSCSCSRYSRSVPLVSILERR